MTYGELLEELQKFTKNQLDQEVSLYDRHKDQYIPTAKIEMARNRAEDEGQPFIPF